MTSAALATAERMAQTLLSGEGAHA
jgi:acetaldehyde dehydrogenase (acetylating)